ncbi:MAG: flagellar biosynthesis protein FliA, partial [Clostridia bacterium]|nr:flagellar biosynthesis protein FliA [Clostridia bacterium]
LLLEYRYFKSLNQTQTAKLLGMTQVQVSRREKALLLKLRAQLV